jgi:hypothetical protein
VEAPCLPGEDAVFFRAMRRAELDNIRETGRLRSADGMCMGKYLATSLEDALAWARKFQDLGWETEQIVLRITVPIDDARQIHAHR